MSTNKSTWKKLTSMRLFMPLVCLLAIIIVATITIPGFLSMSLKNGVPYGYPVDVINRASELVILSVGMTLVTAASGGQDISVGAVMAVAAAVCCQILSGGEVSVNSLSPPIIVAFLAALVASGICGAFNGFLVAKLNIQPMVATLILYTAGRGIAQLITDGQITYIRVKSYQVFGSYVGKFPIPMPVVIAIIVVIIAYVILKKTALGLYIESVGINGGFVASSRIYSADANNIGLNLEMDAILAVALGGNALGGGKFSLMGSVIGAYTIQALTTVLYGLNVSADQLPVYKAIVVVVIVVLQSPVFKKFIAVQKEKRTSKAAVKGGAN